MDSMQQKHSRYSIQGKVRDVSITSDMAQVQLECLRFEDVEVVLSWALKFIDMTELFLECGP